MRAFAFEKEPAFKAMEATSIWGQLISAGASLVGGAMGAKASNKAAKVQAEAEAANLAAQKEAFERSMGYLQPYADRGRRGDAYLDAMLYGSGSYGGAPAGGGGYLSGGNTDAAYRQLLQDRPDLAAEARRLVAAGYSQYNDPVAYAKLWVEKFGQQDALAEAQAKAAATATNPDGTIGPQTITRADAMENLEAQPLWQFNEDDYAQRGDLTDAEYADAIGEAEYGLDTRLANNADLMRAWTDQRETQNNKAIDALIARGGVTGQVGATRRGVAAVGDEYAEDQALQGFIWNGSAYEPYLAARTGATQTRSNRRRGDYDSYSAGRVNAYGGYLDALGGDSDRGYEATTNQAAGGQVYANNTARIRSQAANNQAGYIKEKSDGWGTALQGAVGYLNDAISGRPKTSSTAGHSTPSVYSRLYN